MPKTLDEEYHEQLNQNELQDKLDEFFQTHETFMVRLCAVLELDYLEADEEIVLDKVKALVEILYRYESSNK